LGVDTSKLEIGVYPQGSKNYEYGKANATGSIRGVTSARVPNGAGHWQEGFSDGSFRWDPWNGKKGAEREVKVIYYIIIRPRKEN
jgi:hypothetical protein